MIIEFEGVFSRMTEVRRISPTLAFSDAIVVVDSGSKSEQTLSINIQNDLIDVVKEMKSGQSVFVKCYVNGKEKDGRHYVVLKAIDIFTPTYRSQSASKRPRNNSRQS